MQIFDIFHNCPEQEQQQQQSDPKDLGSKFPRSKKTGSLYWRAEEMEGIEGKVGGKSYCSNEKNERV